MEEKILNSLDNPTEFKINEKIKALIPRPTGEEYTSLKNSIKSNGQLTPITIATDGTILDGHTSYDILKELGITKILYRKEAQSKVNINNFQSVKDYVYSINNRRNLNLYQRASLALEETSATLQNYGEKDSVFDKIQATKHISKRTLYAVFSINEKLKAGKGTPDMEKELNSGELSINEANIMLKNADNIDNAIYLIEDKVFQQQMKEKYEDKKYNKSSFKQLEEDILKHDHPEFNNNEIEGYNTGFNKIMDAIEKLEKSNEDKVAILNVSTNAKFKDASDWLLERRSDTKGYACIVFFELPCLKVNR